MTTKTPNLSAKALVCISAMAACAVLSSSIQAESHVVKVTLHVSTAGLDLDQPADAREVYRRLQKAAFTLCGDANRVDLEPLADFASCYEKALGGALGSVNRPQLTMVYLRTHSLQDAVTHGIDVPPLISAN
jgi:UrcA family protein